MKNAFILIGTYAAVLVLVLGLVLFVGYVSEPQACAIVTTEVLP